MSESFVKKRKVLSDKQWCNIDNAPFYENISVEELKEVSEKGGLDDCCDVAQVKRICEKAESILEVGSGYGRVCSYLINLGVKAKLYSVERSEKFCQHLRKKFKSKLNLFEGDFLNFHTQLQFDVVLMMWMGEISEKELPVFINKAYLLLKKNGVLIIDIVSEEQGPLASEKILDKNYCFSIRGNKIYGYFFEPKEIEKAFKKEGFREIKNNFYKTKNGRNRISYCAFK
jgi:SAM-dependent methyltransferase